MQPDATALRDIADATYVLLATFRRNGDAVGTPVWIVRDGERLMVTTGAGSGKVKRLAHTPRITLTPCDARGGVTPGAPVVEADAVVDDSADTVAALDSALLKKYGFLYRVIRWRAKRRPGTSVPLVITAR